MRVTWTSKSAAFEGTISSVSGEKGKRVVVVAYADGDKQTHNEEDDSFDESKWQHLDTVPLAGPQPLDWSWREVPQGAKDFVRGHMEAAIYAKMKAFITLKSSRPSYYSTVTLPWSVIDHRFFFGTLEDVQCATVDEMMAVLFQVSQRVPSKGIGRKGNGETRLSVLKVMPKVLCRWTGVKTLISFAYGRFDRSGDDWVAKWAEPDGSPGKRAPSASDSSLSSSVSK